jgi:flagellum-specific peptidoglycan hydrolase FlgJ
MGTERTCKTTAVNPEQVFISLAMAWQSITGTLPDRKVILVIHAQSALETGHWKSICNYNLGGSKKHGGCDFTYFTTTERFKRDKADKYLAASKPGSEVTLVSENADSTKTLKFAGKQSMNCFASWETLDDAAKAQLQLLFSRYPRALEAAKRHDTTAYVHELKKGGYFTADEETYRKTVDSIAKSYDKKLANVQFPSIVML